MASESEFEKYLEQEPMILLGGFSQDIARSAWNAALAAAEAKMPVERFGSLERMKRGPEGMVAFNDCRKLAVESIRALREEGK